jgi:signal transduction histidine kinase
MFDRQTHSPRPAKIKRSRLLMLLLLLAVFAQFMTIRSWVMRITTPSCGFVMYLNEDRTFALAPITEAGAAAIKGLEAPVRIVAINGHKVSPALSPAPKTPPHVDETAGARNRFVVRDDRGQNRTLEISTAAPHPRFMITAVGSSIWTHFVGLIYAFIALIVWWKRPQDRATSPFVVMGLCASIYLVIHPISDESVVRYLSVVGMMALPFWAGSSIPLTLRFVGREHDFRYFQPASWILAAVLAAYLGFVMLSGGDGIHIALLLIGIFATTQVIGSGIIALRAARSGSLALRRRARVLAIVMLLSFLEPSLSLIAIPLGAGFNAQLVNGFFFSLFPILLGYAILRHQLFDLRIVLRQGLIFGGVSLVVSLLFLGAAVLIAQQLSAHETLSPATLAVSVGAATIIFGLLQVRVQRLVDGYVNRNRTVYANAIAAASATLSRDRDLTAIGNTVRGALLDAMGLERVYFAVWSDREAQKLDCIPLDPDNQPERTREHLPATIDAHAYAPIARAITSRELVSTHDIMAVAAQSTSLEIDDPRDEAGFWTHFGIEAILPLTLERKPGQQDVVGLLLLGEKCDRRGLNSEDLSLLRTLAHQLAVALESSAAFAEINRLNESLEQKVRERTSALATALEGLKEAQAQLIESETQAMLARLVAAVVHEVNTPLGSLRSAADTLVRAFQRVELVLENPESVDERTLERARQAARSARDLLALLDRSGGRISDVIGSLQSFISLDEAEIKTVDVRYAIDHVLTLLAPKLADAIAVKTQYPDDPALVTGSSARLHKVLLNVLQNAIEALSNAPDGIVNERNAEIAISVGAENGSIEIGVSDNGPGIPKEIRNELFEFGLTQKGGRMGMRLGLPISKRWVDEMHGQIDVQTSPSGTTVRVTLPASG